MAILDTLYIMFEADASSLTKGTDEAKKNTDKLNDALGKADKAGDKLGTSFTNMIATAGGAITALLSVGAMMSGISAATDYADRLGEVSDALGVNIEDLDAWGRAAIFSGGTAEAFQASLSALSADFAMIATKGTSRTLPFFKELGISLKDNHGKMRDIMDVLPDLADKFEGMSKQESIGMGRKLGLDEGTIMMLQRGRRSVEDLVNKQKELGVTTKEQAELASEYNDSIDYMSMAFRSMFMSVGQSVLPAFKWVADALTDLVGFFRKHSDFITGLFIALGAAVMVFLVPPLITAGIAALTAMAPFLLIGAVVAVVAGAFALLYDDVMNFKAGNDSMIGSILEKYPVIGEIIGLIGDTFRFVAGEAVAFWNALTGGIEGFSSSFPKLFALISKIGSVFSTIMNFVLSLWKNVFGTIGDGISGIAKSIGLDFSMEGVKNARSQIQAATSTPLNSTNSSAISNSRVANKSSTVSVGKVEVKTKATDAAGISRAIGGELQGQLKRATSSYDDGIMI